MRESMIFYAACPSKPTEARAKAAPAGELCKALHIKNRRVAFAHKPHDMLERLSKDPAD
jgi:hypothetical protein